MRSYTLVNKFYMWLNDRITIKAISNRIIEGETDGDSSEGVYLQGKPIEMTN